jgi:hypothetical protein
MEDPMRTSDYTMGQLIPTSFLRQATAQRVPVAPVTRPAQTQYLGYPTVQQKDEPDYTTWILVGVAGIAVVGGIMYAKKKRLI